jgi:glycosyltransferase involved in cell wall biosynthesis
MDSGSTPRISVVIPTYNRAPLLAESVDSVLTQQGVAFEVIVVDDGSTDNTAEVLARYGDRIRVVRQANAGFAAARAAGIKAASASLIALHDSDDVMLPDRLRVQREFADAHPEVAVVSGNAVIQGDDQRDYLEACGVDFGGRPWVIYDRPFEKMLERCFLVDAASLIRRDRFIEIGGYDMSLPSSADWDLWLRMARCWPLACLRHPCIWVRKHGGNLSASPAEVAGNIRVIRKALGYGEPIALAVRQRVLERLYRYLKAYLVSEVDGKVPSYSRIEVMRYVSPLPWPRRMAIGIVAAMPRGLLAFGLRQGRRLKRLCRKAEAGSSQ